MRVLLQERVSAVSVRPRLRLAGMLGAMRKFTEACGLRMQVPEVVGTNLRNQLVLGLAAGRHNNTRIVLHGAAAEMLGRVSVGPESRCLPRGMTV